MIFYRIPAYSQIFKLIQATQHCSRCLCNFCDDCGLEHQSQYSSEGSDHCMRPLWEAKRIRRLAVCLDHPAHPLRYHCLACQMVTCKECMWRGGHRGHASEDASSAGARAVQQLSSALKRARKLLNKLLLEYKEGTFDRAPRSRTAFDFAGDRLVLVFFSILYA